MAIFNEIIYKDYIDITIDEWKELIQNRKVFKENNIDFILRFYNKVNYAATTHELADEDGNGKKYNSYNSQVGHLGKRIAKYLNIEAPRQKDEPTEFNYWHVIFLGAREVKTKYFVWILREEIRIALKGLIDDDLLFNSYIDLNEEDFNSEKKIIEGKKIKVTVNRYERDLRGRHICIEHYKRKNNGILKCEICNFRFDKFYGDRFEGKIHIHHMKVLGEIKEGYELDPTEDLIPVCPNCHLIIHSKTPSYSINEVKDMILIK